jgi:hypothetical protein
MGSVNYLILQSVSQAETAYLALFFLADEYVGK